MIYEQPEIPHHESKIAVYMLLAQENLSILKLALILIPFRAGVIIIVGRINRAQGCRDIEESQN
jgi:hypothetical protein